MRSRFLARFAASRATPWTAEECVAASSGTVPDHPTRAWGSVFNGFEGWRDREGWLCSVRWNASPGVLWGRAKNRDD